MTGVHTAVNIDQSSYNLRQKGVSICHKRPYAPPPPNNLLPLQGHKSFRNVITAPTIWKIYICHLSPTAIKSRVASTWPCNGVEPRRSGQFWTDVQQLRNRWDFGSRRLLFVLFWSEHTKAFIKKWRKLYVSFFCVTVIIIGKKEKSAILMKRRWNSETLLKWNLSGLKLVEMLSSLI